MTQYREVKRKANVGERIKITAEISEKDAVGYYRTGDVMTVTDANRWSDKSGVSVKETHWGVFHSEYVVLEPITASETPVTVTIDEFRELQRKVADLETQLRAAREDIALIDDGASADIIRLEAAVFPSKWRR